MSLLLCVAVVVVVVVVVCRMSFCGRLVIEAGCEAKVGGAAVKFWDGKAWRRYVISAKMRLVRC
jgi:hypothetical protein